MALGRTDLTVEDVDRLGQGRIWSGRQAKENGLVDELGGLSLALAIARERAGLEKKSIEIVEFPKKTWLSQLFNNLRFPLTPLFRGGSADKDRENERVGTESRLQFIARYSGLSTTARLLNTIRKHRFFLLMPYHISVGN